VPVPAAARRTLTMPKTIGTLLAALMILLVASLIAIFGAAARESQMEAGATPSASLRRRGRVVMAVTAAALLAILFLGNLWWNAAANERADLMMYKAPPIEASLQNGNTLVLKMGFSSWHDRRKQMLLDKIIPDHGHLMHLFLIGVPDLGRFYHLHPDKNGADTFAERLPSMAAGNYALFADVVRESGFPDTMTTRVQFPDVDGGSPTGDDSETSVADVPTAQKFANLATLPDRSRWEWVRDSQPLHARQPVFLRFRVFDKDGSPAFDLEPYMGMAGHLVIVKQDLTVFAQVHPAGSVPMAALMLLERQRNGDDAAEHTPEMHEAKMRTEVTFPYGFPQPGDYRLFVQIKRTGQVQTGVFEAHVEP
jgi:hypothetical protein